jgi:polar amino acid transport system permease protein
MDFTRILAADWQALFHGLLTTLWLSGLTLALGSVLAMAHVNVRLFASLSFLRLPMQLVVEVVRSTPLLVQLLLVYFGLPLIGISIASTPTAIFVLTVYSAAYLSGIVWGAVESVPKVQWEACLSLGLTRRHLLARFIYPQALRVALPAATGFAVTLIKGSSLVTVIGFADLTHVGKQINELTFQPFIVYGAVVLGYFALCFPLSIVSQRLEGKVRAR